MLFLKSDFRDIQVARRINWFNSLVISDAKITVTDKKNWLLIKQNLRLI